MALMPTTSLGEGSPEAHAIIQHPTSIENGLVRSFNVWGHDGPFATLIQNDIFVADRGTSGDAYMCISGYKKFDGTVLMDTWPEQVLRVGGFSTETIARPSAFTSIGRVFDPAGQFSSETAWFCYTYTVSLLGGLWETPHSTAESLLFFSSNYYADLVAPASGGSYGTVVSTNFYRDERPYDGAVPFRLVGSVGGDGATFQDFGDEDALGASARTGTSWYRPWRVLLIFETSGITGTITSAYLKAHTAALPYDGGGGGLVELQVAAGDSSSRGFGYVLGVDDYSKPYGAGWISGGYSFLKPGSSNRIWLNTDALDLLNDTIIPGGLELHCALVMLDEANLDDHWQFYSSFYSTDGTKHPKLVVTLEDLDVGGGFPGKPGRTLLETMSP